MNVARRLTVLVVDDEASILRLMARSLDAAGYATLEAAGVEEALSCLRFNTVDAAIFDVRLQGGGSGIELLTTVRADPDRATLPILIMTGVTLSDADAGRVRSLGAHLFYKPQPVETLVATLDELLGKRRV